jgi:hypothetical protein
LRLFVLPEYQQDSAPVTGNTQIEKYSGTKFQPIFTVISRAAAPSPPLPLETLFSVIVFLAGVATTFLYAFDLNSINPLFIQRAIAGDSSVVDSVIPIVGGVLLLQILHDAAHYLAAALYNVRMSFPPNLLPSLQIGLFGSINRFLTFPENRKQLFDISIAGPIVGFVASLTVLLYGLTLTSVATPDVLGNFIFLIFDFSFVTVIIGLY